MKSEVLSGHNSNRPVADGEWVKYMTPLIYADDAFSIFEFRCEPRGIHSSPEQLHLEPVDYRFSFFFSFIDTSALSTRKQQKTRKLFWNGSDQRRQNWHKSSAEKQTGSWQKKERPKPSSVAIWHLRSANQSCNKWKHVNTKGFDQHYEWFVSKFHAAIVWRSENSLSNGRKTNTSCKGSQRSCKIDCWPKVILPTQWFGVQEGANKFGLFICDEMNLFVFRYDGRGINGNVFFFLCDAFNFIQINW